MGAALIFGDPGLRGLEGEARKVVLPGRILTGANLTGAMLTVLVVNDRGP